MCRNKIPNGNILQYYKGNAYEYKQVIKNGVVKTVFYVSVNGNKNDIASDNFPEYVLNCVFVPY